MPRPDLRRRVTYFDAASGIITRTQRLGPGRDPAPRAGEAWCEGSFDQSCQVIDPASGLPLPMPALPLTVTGNRIEGLPAGARVSLRGTTFEASGAPVEIAAQQAETVKVWISSLTHLDQVLSLTLDPAANARAARGAQKVELEQDPLRLRLGLYPADGDQIDAFAKALDALIEAAPPKLRADARVQEGAAIIARRKEVKTKLPKPETNK
jgi:hypothetical protein